MNNVIYIIIFSLLLVLILVGIWFMVYFKDNDLKDKLAILVESSDKDERVPKRVNIFKYLKLLKKSVEPGMSVYLQLNIENNETFVEKLDAIIENNDGKFIVKKLTSYSDTSISKNPLLQDVIDAVNKIIFGVRKDEELTISIIIEKDYTEVSNRKFCISGKDFNPKRSIISVPFKEFDI